MFGRDNGLPKYKVVCCLRDADGGNRTLARKLHPLLETVFQEVDFRKIRGPKNRVLIKAVHAKVEEYAGDITNSKQGKKAAGLRPKCG